MSRCHSVCSCCDRGIPSTVCVCMYLTGTHHTNSNTACFCCSLLCLLCSLLYSSVLLICSLEYLVFYSCSLQRKCGLEDVAVFNNYYGLVSACKRYPTKTSCLGIIGCRRRFNRCSFLATEVCVVTSVWSEFCEQFKKGIVYII